MSENGKEPPKSNGTDVPPNEEPLESDPCMEGQDGKKTPFRRYRDEISARTGLSHKGVYIVAGIVILAFLLFIIVISLAAAWPRIPHKYQFPVCKEAECLRAAAQVSSLSYLHVMQPVISKCEFPCSGDQPRGGIF